MINLEQLLKYAAPDLFYTKKIIPLFYLPKTTFPVNNLLSACTLQI